MLTDIIFSNGEFLPQSKILNSFKRKINSFDYHRVVNCTKICLHKIDSKDIIKFMPSMPSQICLILKSKTGCKDFYHALMSS